MEKDQRSAAPTSRYANLAAAANTYRAIGGLLQVLGILAIASGPMLILFGSTSTAITGRHNAGGELVGGLNQTTLGWLWPIVVMGGALATGIPLVLRGIAHAAHGEVMIAIADIAVATSSAAPSAAVGAWHQSTSQLGFALRVLGAVVLVGGLMGFGVVQSLDIASRRPVEPSAATESSPPKKADAAQSARPSASGGPGSSAAASIPGMCTAALTVQDVTPSHASCALSTEVRGGGVVRYPCAGGVAEAQFGSSVFSGTVKDGRVVLYASHAWTYADCTWIIAERIEGAVASPEPLTYAYRASAGPECAIAKQACSAMGKITLATQR